MPPRECDNDDCDYETGVDDNGVPYSRWVHAGACDGPVRFGHPRSAEPHKKSFLAYLMNGPR